jgi:hypothetical protein
MKIDIRNEEVKEYKIIEIVFSDTDSIIIDGVNVMILDKEDDTEYYIAYGDIDNMIKALKKAKEILDRE